MNSKIAVKICTGTMCYVMGGAELQLLDEHLPKELADKVEISGTPCLDICNNGNSGKAPFAKVGDKVISEATINKVITAIKEELNDIC